MSDDPAETPKKVARVNGEPVPDAVFQEELENLRTRYASSMSPAELEANAAQIEADARQNAIERLLLMQTARTVVGPVAPEEIEARMGRLRRQFGGGDRFPDHLKITPDDERRIREDIAAQAQYEKYLETLTGGVPEPTEEECRKHYDGHPDAFLVPETVWARHIVLRPGPGRSAAQVCAELMNLRARILAGEDMAALAQEKSDCHDAGDLGYFARGQMVESFERVAFALPAGEISEPFATEFGYHIVRILDRRPAGREEFPAVRRRIADELWNDRKNLVIGEAVDRLRAEARIEEV